VRIARSRAELAKRLLSEWSRLWNVAGLEDDLTIVYSSRLRRSLGRCRPQSLVLTLHPILKSLDSRWFREVLCHEAAHVVAHRSGHRTPHGAAWKKLMAIAGFEPRIRLKAPASLTASRASPRHGRYEHFCPVCQWSRLARTRISRWRCADCVASGLDGRLAVVKANG
jgi:predicted SprT family Zn-dependent metalloprotease